MDTVVISIISYHCPETFCRNKHWDSKERKKKKKKSGVRKWLCDSIQSNLEAGAPEMFLRAPQRSQEGWNVKVSAEMLTRKWNF